MKKVNQETLTDGRTDERTHGRTDIQNLDRYVSPRTFVQATQKTNEFGNTWEMASMLYASTSPFTLSSYQIMGGYKFAFMIALSFHTISFALSIHIAKQW